MREALRKLREIVMELGESLANLKRAVETLINVNADLGIDGLWVLRRGSIGVAQAWYFWIWIWIWRISADRQRRKSWHSIRKNHNWDQEKKVLDAEPKDHRRIRRTKTRRMTQLAFEALTPVLTQIWYRRRGSQLRITPERIRKKRKRRGRMIGRRWKQVLNDRRWFE